MYVGGGIFEVDMDWQIWIRRNSWDELKTIHESTRLVYEARGSSTFRFTAVVQDFETMISGYYYRREKENNKMCFLFLYVKFIKSSLNTIINYFYKLNKKFKNKCV